MMIAAMVVVILVNAAAAKVKVPAVTGATGLTTACAAAAKTDEAGTERLTRERAMVSVAEKQTVTTVEANTVVEMATGAMAAAAQVVAGAMVTAAMEAY